MDLKHILEQVKEDTLALSAQPNHPSHFERKDCCIDCGHSRKEGNGDRTCSLHNFIIDKGRVCRACDHGCKDWKMEE